MALADLLGQLMNAGNSPYPQADRDFDQVAEQAPPDLLGNGVAEAFRSNQTPPFPDMVSQLFGQSDPTQRAGMLNQILAAVGPAILAGGAGGVLGRVLGGGVGGGMGGAMGSGGMGQGGLGGLLGGILGGGMGGAPMGGGMTGTPMGGAMGGTPMGGAMGGGQIPQVTPEQAQQITPEQMREIAAQAEREQPGVVDQLGGFAARNPQLVKMLGGVAMAIIASKMAQGLHR